MVCFLNILWIWLFCVCFCLVIFKFVRILNCEVIVGIIFLGNWKYFCNILFLCIWILINFFWGLIWILDIFLFSVFIKMIFIVLIIGVFLVVEIFLVIFFIIVLLIVFFNWWLFLKKLDFNCNFFCFVFLVLVVFFLVCFFK